MIDLVFVFIITDFLRACLKFCSWSCNWRWVSPQSQQFNIPFVSRPKGCTNKTAQKRRRALWKEMYFPQFGARESSRRFLLFRFAGTDGAIANRYKRSWMFVHVRARHSARLYKLDRCTPALLSVWFYRLLWAFSVLFSFSIPAASRVHGSRSLKELYARAALVHTCRLNLRDNFALYFRFIFGDAPSPTMLNYFSILIEKAINLLLIVGRFTRRDVKATATLRRKSSRTYFVLKL